MRFIFGEASFVEEGDKQREIIFEPAQDKQAMLAIEHAFILFVLFRPVFWIIADRLSASVFQEEIGLEGHAADIHMVRLDVSFAITLQEVRRHKHRNEIVRSCQ